MYERNARHTSTYIPRRRRCTSCGHASPGTENRQDVVGEYTAGPSLYTVTPNNACPPYRRPSKSTRRQCSMAGAPARHLLQCATSFQWPPHRRRPPLAPPPSLRAPGRITSPARGHALPPVTRPYVSRARGVPAHASRRAGAERPCAASASAPTCPGCWRLFASRRAAPRFGGYKTAAAAP